VDQVRRSVDAPFARQAPAGWACRPTDLPASTGRNTASTRPIFAWKARVGLPARLRDGRWLCGCPWRRPSSSRWNRGGGGGFRVRVSCSPRSRSPHHRCPPFDFPSWRSKSALGPHRRRLPCAKGQGFLQIEGGKPRGMVSGQPQLSAVCLPADPSSTCPELTQECRGRVSKSGEACFAHPPRRPQMAHPARRVVHPANGAISLSATNHASNNASSHAEKAIPEPGRQR
jgi:hypothetical protein